MFHLPATGTAAREACGDLSTLVEQLHPANVGRLMPTRAALRHCAEQLAGAPAGTRINIVVLRADDERWLISVGRGGGWRKVWNFGNGRG